MTTIPVDPSIDSTASFLRQGYTFITNRCRRLGTDAFETRLGLEPAICMQGEEAARAFYAGPLTRRGGMPIPVLLLLQDLGSVQSLELAPHRHRKELFMALLGPDRAPELAAVVDEEWRRSVPRWAAAREIVLLTEVERLLCRAVCRWLGIDVSDGEVTARTAELSAMIDGAGTISPRNWRAQLLRRRTERWAADLIRNARDAATAVSGSDPLAAVALHRDLNGALLEPEVAAVELINILRPTVAVARYVVFAALSLHADPRLGDALARGGDEDLEAFVQEVRRFYPFFPFVAGRVAGEFSWRGQRVPKGRRVLLDLYGTNHDARIWDCPDRFEPERFRGWRGNPFTLIPQGGGDHLSGHRCPGEWVTIDALKASVRGLLRMRYQVPDQSLRISLSRMPAQPESGLVLRDVAAPADGDESATTTPSSQSKEMSSH